MNITEKNIVLKECPICRCDTTDKIAVNDLLCLGADCLQCSNCKFVFLGTQFNDKQSNEFYNDKYRKQKQENYDEERYLGDLERSISQLDFMKEIISKKDRILEIGGGWGTNVNYLYSQGFKNIFVNEFDDNIVKNLNCNIGRTSDYIKDISSNYDVVIMSNVLEHLCQLNDKVKSLRRILNNDGIVFIEVPNRKCSAIESSFSSSYHNSWFSGDNLMSLFKKYDFEVLKMEIVGKNKLIADFERDDYIKFKNNVENGIQSFIELSEDHDKAYFIRLLVRKK